MSRADIAKENFLNGCACAQAVLLAFSDVTGLDPCLSGAAWGGCGSPAAR